MNWLESLQNMTPVFVPFAVLGASFLGSLHCAGMCGPIVQATESKAVEYHGGRLFSYVALGTLAGAFGETILDRVRSAEFAFAAATFFALILIVAGFKALNGSMSRHAPRPSRLAPLWRRAFRFRNSSMKSLSLGLLTPLLPCAWLYSFLLGGALTESPLRGGAFMAAFWLGTLPAFGIVPAFKKFLSPHLGRHLNIAAGALFFAAAFAIVAIRAVSALNGGSCH